MIRTRDLEDVREPCLTNLSAFIGRGEHETRKEDNM
jgi:hypothetical protein